MRCTNSEPRSGVSERNRPPRPPRQWCRAASTAAAVFLGTHARRVNKLMRSVATSTRGESDLRPSTVSISQCPNSARVLMDSGRWAIGVARAASHRRHAVEPAQPGNRSGVRACRERARSPCARAQPATCRCASTKAEAARPVPNRGP